MFLPEGFPQLVPIDTGRRVRGVDDSLLGFPVVAGALEERDSIEGVCFIFFDSLRQRMSVWQAELVAANKGVDFATHGYL